MVRQEENNSLKYRNILIGFIVLLVLIIFRELRIYIGGFLAAITLYSIMRGQMRVLVEKRKWKRSLSATVIVLGALLFILAPLTGLGFLVADTISGINIDPAQITASVNDFISSLEKRFGIEIFTPENIALPKVSTSLMQTLVKSLYSMVINSIIALFLLYFMLYSYDSIQKSTLEILPFREENKKILQAEVRSIIQANAIGIPAVAIIQGILAYVGYMFFGVNNALVYAVLVAFTTIIPVVGTALVWVPIGATTLFGGEVSRGIFLLLYGLLIIGGSDTIIRFVLQKKLANIHPLITFFGVLMGLPMFGFWGVIFGPLLISLLVLFINMYRHDYVPGSDAIPRATTKEGKNPSLPFKRKATLAPPVKIDLEQDSTSLP